MIAGVPGNVSSHGSSSPRRTGHFLPLARGGEPTSTTRASGGTSSERRSGASGGAADDAAEGMGEHEVPPEESMGGRGGSYHRRSSCSDGSRAAPLIHHHPASPPVSSRKTHGGDDASSFAALRLDKEQERLLTRANFFKQPSIQLRVGPQAARQSSLPGRRVEVGNQVSPRFFHRHRQHVGAIGATNEEISPRINEKENEVDGRMYWQTDSMSSRILSAPDWNSEYDAAFKGSSHIEGSVEGDNQVPPRSMTTDRLDTLMRQACFSHNNYSPHMGALDDTNEQRLLKDGERVRLSTIAIFLKTPSIQRNIRLQAARHASLPEGIVEVGKQASETEDKVDEMPPRGEHMSSGYMSSNFPRKFHSSRWIVLTILVVCAACFLTPADGFQLHPNVETAANALRGVQNIHQLQNQLHNELGVHLNELEVPPVQPFDWGLLFFLGACFLVWLIIRLLGDVSTADE